MELVQLEQVHTASKSNNRCSNHSSQCMLDICMLNKDSLMQHTCTVSHMTTQLRQSALTAHRDTVTPACIRQKPGASVHCYRTGQAAYLRAIAEGVRSEPGSPASKQAKSGTQLAGPVLAARPGNLPVQVSGIHQSPYPCNVTEHACTALLVSEHILYYDVAGPPLWS